MNNYIKLLFGIACLSVHGTATNVILCYYESWAQWHFRDTFVARQVGKFLPTDIPANKCTHIVYAFITPDAGGGIKPFNDDRTLQQLVDLKKRNGKLKVMVSIGGWNAGSTDFSKIVSKAGTRGKFVHALGGFVDRHHLDGIDIDWEYPAQRGGAKSDKANFVNFLRDLRKRLGGHRVITAAVGAGTGFIGSSYDVRGLNQHLTYINLMTYDYHSPSEAHTGQNAPLYASKSDRDRSLNSDATVKAWLKNGASASKLLLGLAFYGHTYKLRNPADHAIGAPTTGSGVQNGVMTYAEICHDLNNERGWTSVFDGPTQSPYSYKGSDWYGYDNVKSIKIKTEYAVKHDLAGVIVWAVDHDDLHGACGLGKMPMISAINTVLHT